jgi:hypothetical protein
MKLDETSSSSLDFFSMGKKVSFILQQADHAWSVAS